MQLGEYISMAGRTQRNIELTWDSTTVNVIGENTVYLRAIEIIFGIEDIFFN